MSSPEFLQVPLNSHQFRRRRFHAPLVPYLRSIGRWLRMRDGLLLASRTLWLALAGVAVVLVAGRLWPIEHLMRWALAPLVAWLLAVPGYSLFRPLPLDEVARRTDRMLRLKERLSTALELAMEDATGPLVERQQEDALWVATRIVPRRDIRLTADRPALKRAMALLLVAVALAVWPNPMDTVLRQRAAVRAEAREQARRVEELREELRRETTPTSEEREELLRRLAELARALRQNPGSAEQALADISETEAALRAQLDPQMPARRAALENLAAQLRQLATQQTGHQPDNARDALAALADALADPSASLRAGQGPEQQAALARQLDQLATQATATDTDPSTSSGQRLAHALAALADAVRAGDAQAAGRASQSAQAALTNAERELDLQVALARALARLQEGRTAIARAAQQGRALAQGQGRGTGQDSGQEQGRGAGQGQNPGQGRGAGRGQGAGQGQPGGGGGTNARRLPPASRVGRAGEPRGPARRPGVGELEEVYAPRIPGTPGDVEFTPGQQGPGGQTVTRRQRQPLPGQPGRATVPYREIFPAFRDAAAAALEREYIPPGLRDYVREYFSRLEP